RCVFTCTGWKPVPPKNRRWLLGGTGFQPLCLYLHRLEAGATQESSMVIGWHWLPAGVSLLAPAGSRCHPRIVDGYWVALASSRCVFTCTGWKPVPPKNRRWLLGGTGFQPVCLYLHRLEAGATQESSMILALPQRLLLHPYTRLVRSGLRRLPESPYNSRVRCFHHRCRLNRSPVAKRVAVLGSTGSIGTSTLDVARHLPDRLKIIGLAANSKWEALAAQCREFRPPFAVITDAAAFAAADRSKFPRETELLSGEAGAVRLAS